MSWSSYYSTSSLVGEYSHCLYTEYSDEYEDENPSAPVAVAASKPPHTAALGAGMHLGVAEDHIAPCWKPSEGYETVEVISVVTGISLTDGRTFLLCVDAASPPRAAIAFVKRVAHSRDTVYILGSHGKSNEEDTHDYLNLVSAELAVLDIQSQPMLVWGGAGKRICEHASALRADFVVVGARKGLTKWQRATGSVSTYVVHHCDRPVIVAKDTQYSDIPGPGHVMCAVDQQGYANKALATVLSIMDRTQHEFTAVAVYDPADDPETTSSLELEAKLEDFARQCSGQDYVCNVSMDTGPPRVRLCAIAEDLRVDTLVVGSRGLGAIKRNLVKSVSDYLLRYADVNAIIVVKA